MDEQMRIWKETSLEYFKALCTELNKIKQGKGQHSLDPNLVKPKYRSRLHHSTYLSGNNYIKAIQ
jgi:hypothetical protein